MLSGTKNVETRTRAQEEEEDEENLFSSSSHHLAILIHRSLESVITFNSSLSFCFRRFNCHPLQEHTLTLEDTHCFTLGSNFIF